MCAVTKVPNARVGHCHVKLAGIDNKHSEK